jgi:hypothetical protein
MMTTWAIGQPQSGRPQPQAATVSVGVAVGVEAGFKDFAAGGIGVAVAVRVGVGEGAFTTSVTTGVKVGLAAGETSEVSLTRAGPADISATSGARVGPAQPARNKQLNPRIRALRKPFLFITIIFQNKARSHGGSSTRNLFL